MRKREDVGERVGGRGGGRGGRGENREVREGERDDNVCMYTRLHVNEWMLT